MSGPARSTAFAAGAWARSAPDGSRGRVRSAAVAWAGALAAVVLVVLAARALAYALVPAGSLVGAVGGPALPIVIVVSLALGLGAACAVLWAASLGVRERARLERRAAPRLALRAFAVRAGGLFVASAGVFAALESSLHWRAGLGLHGLHCLTGPVHHDAAAILAALSLLASALIAAVRHVVAWMRRTIALLRGRRSSLRRVRVRPRAALRCGRLSARRAGARGPPAWV